MQKKFIALGIVIVLLIIAIAAYTFLEKQKVAAINSFTACKNAGYPIMESFPEQCITPDKRVFVHSTKPQDVEVSGEFVCLPHKNTLGPQTMECALGIKGDNGKYYGVRDTDPNYTNVSGLGTGVKVTIKGKLLPQNDSKYASVGMLTIESLEQL